MAKGLGGLRRGERRAQDIGRVMPYGDEEGRSREVA